MQYSPNLPIHNTPLQFSLYYIQNYSTVLLYSTNHIVQVYNKHSCCVDSDVHWVIVNTGEDGLTGVLDLTLEECRPKTEITFILQPMK